MPRAKPSGTLPSDGHIEDESAKKLRESNQRQEENQAQAVPLEHKEDRALRRESHMKLETCPWI